MKEVKSFFTKGQQGWKYPIALRRLVNLWKPKSMLAQPRYVSGNYDLYDLLFDISNFYKYDTQPIS